MVGHVPCNEWNNLNYCMPQNSSGWDNFRIPQDSVCPGCGRCDTCGRGGYGLQQPYIWPQTTTTTVTTDNKDGNFVENWLIDKVPYTLTTTGN